MRSFDLSVVNSRWDILAFAMNDSRDDWSVSESHHPELHVNSLSLFQLLPFSHLRSLALLCMRPLIRRLVQSAPQAPQMRTSCSVFSVSRLLRLKFVSCLFFSIIFFSYFFSFFFFFFFFFFSSRFLSRFCRPFVCLFGLFAMPMDEM